MRSRTEQWWAVDAASDGKIRTHPDTHTIDANQLAGRHTGCPTTREWGIVDNSIAIGAGQHYHHVVLGAQHKTTRSFQRRRRRRVAGESIGECMRRTVCGTGMRHTKVRPTRATEILQGGEADPLNAQRPAHLKVTSSSRTEHACQVARGLAMLA
jgi:hypothetical protein